MKTHIFFFNGPMVWVRHIHILRFELDKEPPKANTAADFPDAEKIAFEAVELPPKDRSARFGYAKTQ